MRGVKGSGASALLIKGKTTAVKYEDLVKIPMPKPLGKVHKPIPHKEVVDTLNDIMVEAGYKLRGQEIAISNKGMKLFGVSTFDSDDDEMGFALGYYHSNDESMRLKIVAGYHVFVCSNKAITGDAAIISKYHTKHFSLADDFRSMLDSVRLRFDGLAKASARLKQAELKDEQAKSLLCDMATGEDPVIPLRLLPEVYANFFEPKQEWTDCHGKTRWSLHNATTRAANVLSLPMKMRVARRASDLLKFRVE